MPTELAQSRPIHVFHERIDGYWRWLMHCRVCGHGVINERQHEAMTIGRIHFRVMHGTFPARL